MVLDPVAILSCAKYSSVNGRRVREEELWANLACLSNSWVEKLPSILRFILSFWERPTSSVDLARMFADLLICSLMFCATRQGHVIHVIVDLHHSSPMGKYTTQLKYIDYNVVMNTQNR